MLELRHARWRWLGSLGSPLGQNRIQGPWRSDENQPPPPQWQQQNRTRLLNCQMQSCSQSTQVRAYHALDYGQENNSKNTSIEGRRGGSTSEMGLVAETLPGSGSLEILLRWDQVEHKHKAKKDMVVATIMAWFNPGKTTGSDQMRPIQQPPISLECS
ncbi:hypothetical protein VTL71DRAFT_15575 [Oculimacula yallundae]|uniref:Uncharacterized protein n=1 Tax=Oculimacula yallundae TaxID=86028 RepID=A0ABR4CHQ6_9HELO